MIAAQETILASVAGSNDASRLLLVLVQSTSGGNRVELREQTWADGVGWYTQSSVRIETEQVAELRNALGMGGAAAKLRGDAPQAASPSAGASRGPARQSLRIVG